MLCTWRHTVTRLLLPHVRWPCELVRHIPRTVGENRFGFAGELWRLRWLGKSSETMATTTTLPVSQRQKKGRKRRKIPLFCFSRHHFSPWSFVSRYCSRGIKKGKKNNTNCQHRVKWTFRWRWRDAVAKSLGEMWFEKDENPVLYCLCRRSIAAFLISIRFIQCIDGVWKRKATLGRWWG